MTPALRAASLAALLLAGCTKAPAPSALGPAEPVAFPAADSSLVPQFAVDPAGIIHATWFEKLPGGRRALKLSRFENGAWGEPRVVAMSDSLLASWADVPALLAAGEGRLAIAFPWRSGEGHAHDVHIVQSRDDGATWSPPVTPHRDHTATEHGFTSLFEEGSQVRAVWLDGRNAAAGNGHGALEEGEADMMLRTALIDPAGALSDESVLDERTCDCCPTAAIVTPAGATILYRDRTAEEIRDFTLMRRSGGTWTAGVPLHDDGWKMPGCPVSGAALDGSGNQVAAAWFTEAGGRPMVYFARSIDGGATFGPPVAVSDTSTLGRAGVVMREDGTALVSWLDQSAGEARLLVRRIAADGTLGTPVEIARTTARRSSGVPRMARSGSRVVFAWTEVGENQSTRVRSAVAEWR